MNASRWRLALLLPRALIRAVKSLFSPHVVDAELERRYREMAQDEAHERDALEFIEAIVEGEAALEEP